MTAENRELWIRNYLRGLISNEDKINIERLIHSDQDFAALVEELKNEDLILESLAEIRTKKQVKEILDKEKSKNKKTLFIKWIAILILFSLICALVYSVRKKHPKIVQTLQGTTDSLEQKTINRTDSLFVPDSSLKVPQVSGTDIAMQESKKRDPKIILRPSEKGAMTTVEIADIASTFYKLPLDEGELRSEIDYVNWINSILRLIRDKNFSRADFLIDSVHPLLNSLDKAYLKSHLEMSRKNYTAAFQYLNQLPSNYKYSDEVSWLKVIAKLSTENPILQFEGKNDLQAILKDSIHPFHENAQKLDQMLKTKNR